MPATTRVTLLMALSLLLVPSALAQSATITVHAELTRPEMPQSGDPPRDILLLDSEGRGQRDLVVGARAQGFSCATPATLHVDIGIADVPAWAAATIKPSEARWTLPTGQPGPGPTELPPSQHTLLVDRMEAKAPSQAAQSYGFQLYEARLDGGPCLPLPSITLSVSPPELTACMRPEDGGPRGEDCTAAPEPLDETAWEKSPPIPGATLPTTIVAALLVVAYRHRK